MLRRFCDKCGGQMADAVHFHSTTKESVGLSISVSTDIDICSVCMDNAVKAFFDELSKQNTIKQPAPASVELAITAPAVDLPPIETVNDEYQAPPTSEDSGQWMSLKEITAGTTLVAETVRTRLRSMKCPERMGDNGKKCLYLVTPSQLEEARNPVLHSGFKTGETNIPEGWYTVARLAVISCVDKHTIYDRAKVLGVEQSMDGHVLLFHPTAEQLDALKRKTARTGRPKCVIQQEIAAQNAEKLRQKLMASTPQVTMSQEKRDRINAQAKVKPVIQEDSDGKPKDSETILKILGEAEDTGALPAGKPCPYRQRDSTQDHVQEFQRKLKALKAHEKAGRLLTIDGFTGIPKVEGDLTVELVAPGGRTKIFLVSSVPDSEVLNA